MPVYMLREWLLRLPIITDYAPISKTPQLENVYMTQYDWKMLEEAGLIKMDFLGLKELKNYTARL